MDKTIGSSLIGAGAGLASGVISMIGQRKREKRAMRNQEHLMDIQQRNQMNLNEQGHKMQKDMWDYTNYPNQVKAMKEAGLSTGLMYGMGGGGGTTAGSQGGGSAAGGQAPAPQPMEIGTALSAAKLAAEVKLLEAQKNNIDADTGNKTGKQGGIEAESEMSALKTQVYKLFGQQAESIDWSNQTEAGKAVGKMLYGKWANVDGGEEWFSKDTEAGNRAEELLLNDYINSEVESRIISETEEHVKNRVKWDYFNTMFDAKLKEAKVDLTKEQERKLWHDIWQGWTNAGLRGLDTIIKGRLKDIGKGKNLNKDFDKQSIDKAWGEGFKEGIDHMKPR